MFLFLFIFIFIKGHISYSVIRFRSQRPNNRISKFIESFRIAVYVRVRVRVRAFACVPACVVRLRIDLVRN